MVIPRLRTDAAFARAADDFVREVGAAGLPTAAARVPSDDVPTIRRYAVHPARRLAASGHAGAPPVVRWLDAGRADPLPEVRAAATERITRGRSGRSGS